MTSFFSEPENEELCSIVVDYRERPSGIQDVLRDWGIQISMETLEIADYVISPKCAAERKSGRDFYSSLFDSEGRLFKQAMNLSNAYEKPVWIVEGSIPSQPNSINSLLGALLSLSLDYGIHVLFSANILETARYLRLLCKREWEENRGRINIYRPKKPKDSIPKLQLYLVSSFPNWSGETAKRALELAKTPRNLFTFKPDDLKKIEGVGQKRIEEFLKIMDSEFPNAKTE